MNNNNENKNIKKTNFFSKRGFISGYSIVEILVYLAIFTSISILVINLFITIIASFNVTSINRKLLESGNVSMERISREIRQAENIDIANSSSNSLQLNSVDSVGSNFVIKFSSIDGDLNLYKDGVFMGNLLNEEVVLTNLIFRRISTTQGEAVKIEMSLQYTEGKSTKTENFYNTIILRGGY
ncbi:MAG: hypothetical protein JJE53_02635 [Candidatus Pacebacteria bacterium]|nr:hypothetical protein [Candidatus Paceibacterota bacterium]